VFLGAAPLVGQNFRDSWDWRFGWSLIGAGVLAGAVMTLAARGWYDQARLRVIVRSTAVDRGRLWRFR
jgi:hypothetical protein